MALFRRRRVVLGLKQLEAAVGATRAAGVNPSRDVMVAMVSLAEALGVPVTAKEEGEVEVNERRLVAAQTRGQILVVRQKTAQHVEVLKKQIETVEEAGRNHERRLAEVVVRSNARADDVVCLLELLP